jgi:single-strand DNA-binding protein
MSINKVILLGHVGKDAEVRYLDNGVAVASFSLATSETYTAKNGEKVTTTEWHNIIAWRALGEFSGKYIKKGIQIYVEGQLRTRSYDDKEGHKKYVTEIYASNIQLLGRKESSDGNGQNQAPTTDYTKTEAVSSSVSDFDANDSTDDLPF